MAICNMCGATSFRTSRFRMQDIERFFHLELPVRCRVCYSRQYAGIKEARKIKEADKFRRAKMRARQEAKESAQRTSGKQVS